MNLKRSGMLIFINRAPILWYSKRQNTVGSSTFGSELIVLKSAIEMLRYFGILEDGSSNVMCHNDTVAK